jgi:hypothetical protein
VGSARRADDLSVDDECACHVESLDRQ